MPREIDEQSLDYRAGFNAALEQGIAEAFSEAYDGGRREGYQDAWKLHLGQCSESERAEIAGRLRRLTGYGVDARAAWRWGFIGGFSVAAALWLLSYYVAW